MKVIMDCRSWKMFVLPDVGFPLSQVIHFAPSIFFGLDDIVQMAVGWRHANDVCR